MGLIVNLIGTAQSCALYEWRLFSENIEKLSILKSSNCLLEMGWAFRPSWLIFHRRRQYTRTWEAERLGVFGAKNGVCFIWSACWVQPIPSTFLGQRIALTSFDSLVPETLRRFSDKEVRYRFHSVVLVSSTSEAYPRVTKHLSLLLMMNVNFRRQEESRRRVI